MFMIDYKELSWRYWFVTACLLTAGVAGYPSGFLLAIGLTVIQLVHFTAQVRIVHRLARALPRVARTMRLRGYPSRERARG
mgnify:CR=1 FL=1